MNYIKENAEKKDNNNNKDLKLETTVTYTTGCYAKCIYYFKKGGERERIEQKWDYVCTYYIAI